MGPDSSNLINLCPDVSISVLILVKFDDAKYLHLCSDNLSSEFSDCSSIRSY